MNGASATWKAASDSNRPTGHDDQRPRSAKSQGFRIVAVWHKKLANSPLNNPIWLWDRLSSRSFQARQRASTGWKACPTYFFNGLLRRA